MKGQEPQPPHVIGAVNILCAGGAPCHIDPSQPEPF